MTTGLEVTTPSPTEALIVRSFAAPRRLVFDAYTKPELVTRWMLGPPGWTMPVCEIDLRPGGRFRWEWKGAEGQTMGVSGVYKEVVAPERTVHTELFDEDWTGGETLVTTLFSESGRRTTVSMTVRYSSTAARDAAVSMMADGMEMGYQRLDAILAAAQAA